MLRNGCCAGLQYPSKLNAPLKRNALPKPELQANLSTAHSNQMGIATERHNRFSTYVPTANYGQNLTWTASFYLPPLPPWFNVVFQLTRPSTEEHVRIITDGSNIEPRGITREGP